MSEVQEWRQPENNPVRASVRRREHRVSAWPHRVLVLSQEQGQLRSVLQRDRELSHMLIQTSWWTTASCNSFLSFISCKSFTVKIGKNLQIHPSGCLGQLLFINATQAFAIQPCLKSKSHPLAQRFQCWPCMVFSPKFCYFYYEYTMRIGFIFALRYFSLHGL